MMVLNALSVRNPVSLTLEDTIATMTTAKKIRPAHVEAHWMLSNIVADTGGNITFPVDVARIMNVLDIVLVKTDAQLPQMTIYWRELQQRAYVEAAYDDSDDVKLRYQLALAIGMIHYTNVLATARTTVEVSATRDDDMTRFARAFATALLAPTLAVQQRHRNGFNTGALSRIFAVEESVIADVLLDG